MRFTIKFLLLVQITLAAIVALGPAKPALACSGFPETIDQILERTQYVVKATVVETDDLGQNYILEAETYLAGGPGPKYLLLALNQPEMIEGLLLDLYGGGDCNSLISGLSIGESAYLFVYRQSDGSFATASSLFNPIFYPYYSGNSSNPDEKVFDLFVVDNEGAKYWQPTEQEFVDFIVERTGDTPTIPDSDSRYPMLAPLLLTSAAGSLYLLPVDFGPPVKLERDSQLYGDYIIPHYQGSCASLNCRETSSNGLFNATQTEADEIRMDAYDGDLAFPTGQGFLFSSTSEAIAIWNNPALEIRYIRYPGGAMREYDMDLINTTELQISSAHVFQSFVGIAQWSPDGRFLAFTDADGLWLWDVYTENANPRLLIPVAENGDLPVADYFSPRGRYLAFSQGAIKETLDTISGQHYPYGLVSPDDRTLLAFNDLLSDDPVQVCSLTPYHCTKEIQHLRQVAWQNDTSYFAISCYPELDCDLKTSVASESINGDYFIRSESSGEMFAYDSQLDLLAVLSEGYSVTINDITLDLTDGLDGYVVNMEWLPSMFYFVD